MNPPGETYATLLTASGPGAIGIIRVVGPAAFPAIATLFRPNNGPALTLDHLADARLRYGHLVAADEILDDVLIAAVPEISIPAFDITAHGGVRVLERILAALESCGAPFRPANPDSATYKSQNFIAQEALTALRRARTSRAVKFLAYQRTELPRALTAIRNQLTTDPIAARSALAELLHRTPAAINLIDGLTVVLVGPPNSGKSTLFNRLVGRPAAIVSPQPGTTRDWITADLDVSGLPVTLIDTAGVRDETEALEREAIARGRQIAQSASLRLLILDAAHPQTPKALADFQRSAQPDAIVYNKMDLLADDTAAPCPTSALTEKTHTLPISAATGHNFDALTTFILTRAGLASSNADNFPSFFTHRQQQIAADLLSAPPDLFTTSAADGLANLLLPHPPQNP